MLKLKALFASLKLTYQTYSVQRLRKRIAVLSERLNGYVKKNEGTDSADRMQIVIETSHSIVNGMDLIHVADKLVYLKGVAKELKSMIKLNEC